MLLEGECNHVCWVTCDLLSVVVCSSCETYDPGVHSGNVVQAPCSALRQMDNLKQTCRCISTVLAISVDLALSEQHGHHHVKVLGIYWERTARCYQELPRSVVTPRKIKDVFFPVWQGLFLLE